MNKFIFACFIILIAYSAVAKDCFESNVDPKLDGITIPKTVCVHGLGVDLKPFSASVAYSTISTGEGEVQITSQVPTGRELANGNYAITIDLLGLDETDGVCDGAQGFSIKVKAEIDKNGELVAINEMDGSAYKTYDYCHDPARNIDLNYQRK